MKPIIIVVAAVVLLASLAALFARRPDRIDETKLEFGTIDDPEPPGIMHVPLSNAAFTRLRPVFLQQSRVTSEELEPIENWRGGGGYWP